MDESSRSVALQKNLPAEAATFNCDNSSFAIGPNSTINNHQTNVIVLAAPTEHQPPPLPSGPMNHSCYNLIVLEADFSHSNCVTIPNELVFNESIRPQLKERFGSLDTSAQAELRSFPCIFATPNHHGNQTDANHQAHVGIITDITLQKHSVKIDYYRFPYPISQQRLNQIVSDLHIQHADLSNEFDTPHWTVKEVSLRSVFQRNNIDIPFFTA